MKAKWLPVPSPHPTLAFELKIEAKADLVLLDSSMLGALLLEVRSAELREACLCGNRSCTGAFRAS